MIRNENSNVVSSEDNNINEIEENVETNTEESVKPLSHNAPTSEHGLPESKEARSTITASVHISSTGTVQSSVPNIDTKPSRKYPITLEQARMRVLKAIIKAKKRKLLLEEDD